MRTAITESLAVAEAYLHEHQQAIRADVLGEWPCNHLNRDSVQLALNPQHLQQVVSAQAALRGLTEAMVFDRAGNTLARSSFSFTLGFEPVPDDVIHLADTGDVAIMTNDSDDRVRALVRLQPVRRRLSLCRTVYRTPRLKSHGGDPAGRRVVRGYGTRPGFPGFRLPSR